MKCPACNLAMRQIEPRTFVCDPCKEFIRLFDLKPSKTRLGEAAPQEREAEPESG